MHIIIFFIFTQQRSAWLDGILFPALQYLNVWWQLFMQTHNWKHYKTNACPNCAARQLCTKNLKGRLIERSEFATHIEQNIEANPQIYKKRQSIVEHPYGTIKRQWGFYYIITKKGMKRASADVGFMFHRLQPSQADEHP